MQTIEIRDAQSGNSAKVLLGLGFNCYEWNVQFDDGTRDLLWAEEGFSTGEKRPSGSGIPLLFPFPGRIGHAQFKYDGRTYIIPHDPSRPHALHGFIFDRPWRLVEESDAKVTAAFQASVDDPSILNCWPSDFAVEATYEVVGPELRFSITFRNTGYDPLPWGFGTHAYFRLPLHENSQVGESVLTAPVDGEWKLDDMLPTGELVELPAELSLSAGQQLGDLQFDTPYRLSVTEGEVTTVVADPASGRRVVQEFATEHFPQAVIYTPGDRQAVCIEPYSCVPDPFRLEEKGIASGLRVLPPGESYTMGFVLRAEEV
ncbi:aldose 1-epimerase [Aeoliella sp. ICT_H6.2]|uniref:Aldose 1-epimerase n=1 Tax=Aeoliella straminimaris TaxID=2954799 RepID=A0A9X2FGU6_9BACT|nr:aldose 1-epimerase [Aeoliella straminimaris]MCO6047947.1 aldose 1-epimerase [Aeoliella straminimaris]